MSHDIDTQTPALSIVPAAPQQAARSDDVFPVRVPIHVFPNQPPGNEPRLPKTLPNVAYLLKANEVEVSYDVIRKRVRIERRGKTLTESDLISLANFNRLYFPWFPDFVITIAQRNPVNPVAEWIDSQPWDGVDRLPEIYSTVEVEEDFPPTMRDTLIHRWLLSAVAAAKVPKGFRARGVLTFQGAQGLGKTSWINRLVPEDKRQEWIKLDHHLDAGNKDSILGAVEHWIVEIGELESSFRKDVARLKGYLTNDCDKLRVPYGKRAIEMERRTVHAATVNDQHFLNDNTGNSRWWTLPVTKLDYLHNVDMQQLYAQLAVELADGGEWWLTQPEEQQLEELNRRHRAVSVIAERLLDRLAPDAPNGQYMTATEVLREVGVNHPSNLQCKEAGATLRLIYGPPKRVQGRDRWRVSIGNSSDYWKQVSVQPDEDIY